MRAVIQRVTRASVTVDSQCVSAVGLGLLVLLGVSKHDSQSDCDYVVQKILGLRIFNDAEGKMNLSVQETGGAILVVSQFTLYGDARKGRRPGFDLAAAGTDAEHWYSQVVAGLRSSGLRVSTGKFGEHMQVELENDGPVTLLLDSGKAF
ncbi:MAG: D-aminoacyl-tRNA deacylase [Acidobacteriaceae bacterium]